MSMMPRNILPPRRKARQIGKRRIDDRINHLAPVSPSYPTWHPLVVAQDRFARDLPSLGCGIAEAGWLLILSNHQVAQARAQMIDEHDQGDEDQDDRGRFLILKGAKARVHQITDATGPDQTQH